MPDKLRISVKKSVKFVILAPATNSNFRSDVYAHGSIHVS